MLSLEAQKKKFLSLKARNSIKAGSTAFLISAAWFNNWKAAVGIDTQQPKKESNKNTAKNIKIPPINNKILLINGRLKPTLTEKYDFIILSPPLWKLLYEWYPGEGPEIQVEMIDHPVEHIPVPILHELTFSVYYPNNINPNDENNNQNNDDKNKNDHNSFNEQKSVNMKFIEVKVNKYQKIGDIKEKVCEILNVDPESATIRDFWNYNSLPSLPDEDYIYNKHLVDTQELLLQIKDTKSPMAQRRNRLVSRTNSSMTIGNTPYLSFRPETRGHVGLSNLGNTCFFNSAVQALSHTEMLAAFFANARWRENINSTNRFSTNGIIANAYAQIVNDIWYKNFSYITPNRLFDVVSEYSPRFADHLQHDAQELMMFLLDGLHEDLNRANKNVYIEGVEGDSTSEQVAAEAAWKRHKLTNDSIIVDLFHGQLESQLECPNCHCKKIVFDPYLCVTLPMPTERMSSIKYFYIPYDMKQMRYFVKTRVITTTEEENAKEDAIRRFINVSRGANPETEDNDNNENTNANIIDDNKDCVIMERDDLICNFGLKLPPIFRRSDYIIFEIPDKRKLYTVSSVHAQFNKRGISDVIDGPILIEIPDDIIKSQAKLVKLIETTKSKKAKKQKNKKDARASKAKQTKKREVSKKPAKQKKEGPKKKSREAEKRNKTYISPKITGQASSRSTMQTRSHARPTVVTSPSRPARRSQPRKATTTIQTRMQTRRSESSQKNQKKKPEITEYEEEDQNEEENESEEENNNENEEENTNEEEEINNRNKNKNKNHKNNKNKNKDKDNDDDINSVGVADNDDDDANSAGGGGDESFDDLDDDEREDMIRQTFESISNTMQKAVEERFGVYWEDTAYPLIDQHRQMDLYVSPTISEKLLDGLGGSADRRMLAESINASNSYIDVEVGKAINNLRLSDGNECKNNVFFFEKSPDTPYFTQTSVKVTLNPLQSRITAGFNWPAVMPISKAINKSDDSIASLSQCLECFSYPDKLDELNEWFCPTCRKLVRAIARLDLWSVPDNLILHLKRFVYKDGNYKKVFGKINFPEIIDLQPFVRGPQKNESSLKYKIHAVINHIGTMNGGHYTTSAFSNPENKWFTYNDEAVYPTVEKITYSELPYVLFYHRINDDNKINL